MRAQRSQQQALDERDEALRQRNLAVARELAVKASFLQKDDESRLPQSMLLAAESIRRAPSLEADRTLRRGLALLARQVAQRRYPPANYCQASRGNRIAFFSRISDHDGDIHIVDLLPDRFVKVRQWRADSMVHSMSFDATGTRLSFVTSDDAAYLWNLSDRAPRRIVDCEDDARASAVSANWFAVGCEDQNMQLVDLASGALRDAGAGTYNLIGLAFSDDGKYLAGVSKRDGIVVWRTDDWKEMLRASSGDGAQIAFSRRGSLITNSTGFWDQFLYVWNFETGKEVARLPHDAPVSAIDFDESGALLATGSENGKVSVFDVARGALIAEMHHQAAVRSVRFAQLNGTDWTPEPVLITSGNDRTARVWRLADWRELTRATFDAPVPLAIPRSGTAERFAALGSDGDLRLFAGGAEAMEFAHPVHNPTMLYNLPPLLTAQQMPAVRTQPHFPVVAASWSAAEHAFVVAYENGRVERLDPIRRRRQLLFDDKFAVQVAAWSADGDTLMESDSGTTKLWDVARRRQRIHLRDFAAWGMSADGSTIAAPEADGLARVVRGYGREPLRVPSDPASKGSGLQALAVSGRHVAATLGRDVVVRLLDDPSGRLATVADIDALRLVISPDERYVAWNGVHPGILDLTTRKTIPLEERKQVEWGKLALFAPAGPHLAMAHENRFVVWLLPAGRRIAAAKTEGHITAMAFSRDGRLFATAGEEGTAHIWSLATGTEIARIDLPPESKGTPRPIKVIALSADSDFLLTSTEEATQIWTLSAARLIAQTCGHVSVRLTSAEWKAYGGEAKDPETCAARSLQ